MYYSPKYYFYPVSFTILIVKQRTKHHDVLSVAKVEVRHTTRLLTRVKTCAIPYVSLQSDIKTVQVVSAMI